MPGFERADAVSIEAVEMFLRDATGEPVTLGQVRLATGLLGRGVATLARARAITFGGLICFAGNSREPQPVHEVHGALERFEGLFVHECVHVWQYRRDGCLFFLRQYLKSYFSGILSVGSIGRRARQQAYMSIPHEREAFQLERRWVDDRTGLQKCHRTPE